MASSSSNTRFQTARKPNPYSKATYTRLLEAAGQVFADKGFTGATGKEICERAKTNSAAINYYFGGVDGLYAAVLAEARDRLVTTEAVVAAVAGRKTAKEKLEAFFGLAIPAVTGPAASSWAIRVLGREIVSPSPAVQVLWKDASVRLGVLKSIVAELMGLAEDHPAVSRGLISVAGPFLMLLVYDRTSFHRMFPGFGLNSENSAVIAHHFVQFSLAGLAAIALESRESATEHEAEHRHTAKTGE